MKKYLMTGIAALAMGGTFTSCGPDMDSYGGNIEDYVKQSYEQKFVERFGEPAPNQTWGFGSSTATVATTRGMTRTIQPSYNFPADADASKFLSEVPAGVEKLTQNAASVNNWIDETWQDQLNIWGQWDGSKTSGGTIYIKGNCDFSNRNFYIAPNTEVYLLEGATLTLSESNAANLQSGCNFYLATKSKIVTSGELKLNNGLHIFNHGTIEANKLSTNSNSWLINGGTVKITNDISVENELSVIENNGTITAANLNTAGSGKFQNNADVTISGTTLINSNSNTWVNNGQYHTGYFVYTAGSDDVINNCRLTVDEDFDINLGDNPGNGNFKMDAGAGVVTKNFNGGGSFTYTYYRSDWYQYVTGSHSGGPFYIYMGANSVFKVTETATMNATKADYGIYGPENGGYAVFQAKNIVKGKEGQGFEVTYGNNLYVSAESHFAQGNDGQADHPFIAFKGNAKVYAPGFESGKPAISISETACNPGFNGGNTETIRVIAEDLNVGEGKTDFDFNDVVFDVIWNKTQGTVSIELLADGAEFTMYIGGTAAGVGNRMTVNEMFSEANGVTIPKSVYPNTAAGAHYAYKTYKFDLNSDEWSGTDIGSIARSIYVRVIKSNKLVTLTAEKGRTASKIAVGTDYDWCDERQDIDDKYNGKFKRYVDKNIDESLKLGDDWYESYIE